MIIGIDHGYYAIKTRHFKFPAGVAVYYKALNIISEYVQTELSAPEKGDTVPRTQKDHQER